MVRGSSAVLLYIGKGYNVEIFEKINTKDF